MKKPGKRVSLILAIIWFAGIWTVSSIPAEDMPSVSIISIDKVAHIGVYLVLAVLVNRYLSIYGASPRRVTIVYLLLLLSAGLDEYHQYMIPGRSVTVYDFIANSIGLLAGYLILRNRYDRSA